MENPIFLYLQAFDPDVAEVAELRQRYQTEGVSNKELKELLTQRLEELLGPMRERRRYYEAHMNEVREAVEHGTKRMRTVAVETMEMVRDALELNYLEQY
ncbi:MAG: hypothetical protein U5Q44_00685 [Dehalococcoidia bacterium]|nr:hypothetical protein [Dehalococcoidia bacterium]